MIQASAKHCRGMPIVLGGAEYHDGIGLAQILAAGLASDLAVNHDCPNNAHGGGDHSQRKPRLLLGMRSARHQCQRICEISSAGMAPSRMICHWVGLPLRSTIVVGVSRLVGPPFTIMAIRSPSWSRTHSAVLHSDRPIRFADVAVIGKPVSRIIARGIGASGTRRATFPVLAVTLSGSRELALTIIVNGPGQYLRANSWNTSGTFRDRSAA